MRHTSTRGRGRSLGRILGAALALFSVVGHAAPRDDMKAAYWSAVEQFNNLELDASQQSLEGAISQAQGAGLSGDPVLAPLLVLRGGIIFSNTADRGRTLAAFEEAVRADYFVQLPIELRSEELQAILDEARTRAGQRPAEAVVHSGPQPNIAGDLEFEAQMGVALPDNAQAALYWRKVGQPDFTSTSMDLFFNFATATIPFSDHEGADLEYFIYVFDANNQPLANKGDQEAPLMVAGVAAGEGADTGGEEGGEEGGEQKDKGPKPSGDTLLPRVWINLGVGTGFGIARGGAELTYQQFNPADPNFQYGPAQQACAITRWFGKDGDVAANGTELWQQFQTIEGAVPGAVPANLLSLQPTDLDLLYNADQCDDRHPIKGGMASSPFFIAPEIAVRIGRAFSLGLFSRLQVVTGSKVYRGDDPTASKDFNEAFANIYGSDNPIDPLNGGVVVPQGEQHKPPFSWAIGLKAKYFFGKDEKRFRVFLGGFTGYGQARLRVPMGFANDHSGNSIPDDQEVPCDVPPGSPDIVCGGNAAAVPVWPYNRSTQNDATGQAEVQRAVLIQQNADRAERIDTVVIGQGFVGILVGFNFQVVKNFAVFAELDAGAWFPNTTSGLFDLVVGPSITF